MGFVRSVEAEESFANIFQVPGIIFNKCSYNGGGRVGVNPPEHYTRVLIDAFQHTDIRLIPSFPALYQTYFLESTCSPYDFVGSGSWYWIRSNSRTGMGYPLGTERDYWHGGLRMVDD